MRFYREERVTVYGPDDVTALTPRTGAAHSDPFQVTTEAGVTGWRPYLLRAQHEAQTSIDRMSGGFEVGDEQLRFADVKVGADNSVRWLSAFVGDVRGRSQLHGALVRREERLTIDGVTGAWETVFMGRIAEHSAPEPSQHGAVMTALVKSEMAAHRRLVFTGTPHHSVTYAQSPLWPIGLQKPWLGLPVQSMVRGTIDRSSATRSCVVARDIPRKTQQTARYRLTMALARAADHRVAREGFSRMYCPLARVTVRRRDTSAEGDFWLAVSAKPNPAYGPWLMTTAIPYDGGRNASNDDSSVFVIRGADGMDRNACVAFGLMELPTTHPRYMAMPANGTDVDFRVQWAGPATADTPLMIGPVTAGEFAADLLDGKFSLLNDSGREDDPNDGTPVVAPIPYDAASLAALPADRELTIIADKPWKLGEMLQSVSLQTQAYFVDRGAGEIHGVDAAPLWTQAAVDALPEIGNGMVASGDWVHGQDTLGAIQVSTYDDGSRESPYEDGDDILNRPPNGLVSTKIPDLLMLRSGARLDRTLQLDATGSRFTVFTPWVFRRYAPHQIALPIRQLYEDGAHMLDLVAAYRDETKACWPGDWRRVDVNSVPNLSTNVRGGMRLMQCVLRQRTATGIRFRFLDAGPDVVPAAPMLSGLALDVSDPQRTARVSVTLAGVVHAIVEVATTDTSVAVRPTEGWTIAAEARTSGEVVIHPVEPGKRLWVRGRTRGLILSPPAYPTPGYVDMTPLAPSVTALSAEYVAADAAVMVRWAVGPNTPGLRLAHDEHHEMVEPIPADPVDVDATLGEYSIAIPADAGGSWFTVEATPYPTFSAGAVSGTPGAAVRRTIQLPGETVPSGYYLVSAHEVEHTDTTVTFEIESGPGIDFVSYKTWLLDWPLTGSAEPADNEPDGIVDSTRLLTVDLPADLKRRMVRLYGYARNGRVVQTVDVLIDPRGLQVEAKVTSVTAWFSGRTVVVDFIANQDTRNTAGLASVEFDIDVGSATFTTPGEFVPNFTVLASRAGASVSTGITQGFLVHGTSLPLMGRVRARAIDFQGNPGPIVTVEADVPQPPRLLWVEQIADGKLRVVGNERVRSVRVARVGGGWSRTIDGSGDLFDMTVADASANAGIGSASWNMEVSGYTVAKVDIVEDSERDRKEIVVTGPGASAPAATWAESDSEAPAIGDDVVTVSLRASSAPTGWTFRVYRRRDFTGGWEDRTLALTGLAAPAPPTTLTAYSDFTTVDRVGLGVFVTWEHRCELLDDTDTVKDSVTIVTGYDWSGSEI